MITITYFDFTNIKYTSPFLDGFIKNEKERGYRLVVSNQMPPEFDDLDPALDWLQANVQPYSIYRYEGKETFLFCIDAGDMNGSDPTGGYYQPLLERCKYFFKVNYNAEVIAQSARLKPFTAKIRPLPVVYPLAISQPWRLKPKLTPFGGQRWPVANIKRRTKHLLKTISLKKYRQLRTVEKDIDLFFVTSIYNYEGYNELNEKRKALVDLLNQHKQFNILAKYVCLGKQDNEDCGPYETEVMHYRDFLSHSARSRIGIYVRGAHGCLSFKFGELMALGMPIVGETLLNNNENLYAYDHFDEQFAYDNPEKMVERIIYLLENPQRLEELSGANIQTFENYLTPKPVVKSILDVLEAG